MPDRAVRVLLLGAVQGCGVRPALARMASLGRWSGSVRNTTAGVELILAGDLPDANPLEQFIRAALPFAAEISELTIASLPGFDGSDFHIEDSDATGPLVAPVPRDVAICGECLAESRDPTNRRFAYPFISCTYCGPRYSVLLAMPFDRHRTTLREFTLCSECHHEYQDPSDRRFHAQTVCCPQCGPQVWATDKNGKRVAFQDEAIREAAAALLRGEILAVRGVGGYQLLADATSSEVVAELRRRKRRPDKPFAVLCRTLGEAGSLATLSEIEIGQLSSLQNPIVLVRQRHGGPLAADINPGLSDIGLLLPTTALHDRLAGLAGRPLICTSGNTEGEPLAAGVDEAEYQLRGVADLFLHHDREISQPVDDSVVRVIANRPVTIRCARGLAPLPMSLTSDSPILAVGGHQKAAVARSNKYRSWLGPHVGDLDAISVQEQWCERLRCHRETVNDFEPCDRSLFTEQVVHDPHPTYFPTQWSEASRENRLAVWHHHAHIAAGMLEHQWLDQTVLGVAFDGTGLGPDGTIWGGEFLIATATKFQRVGHLRPFSLPGGEAAMTDLRRLAVSMLGQLEELSLDEVAGLIGLSGIEASRILKAIGSSHSIRTTSCGRLFDAAACLILQQSFSAFEGQAAMRLEAACDLTDRGEYPFEFGSSQPIEVDWRPVLRQIIAARRSGTKPGVMAMRFHRGLANAIQSVCERWPELSVIMGGGVFQNRVLVELMADSWTSDRAPLGLPGLIPPNDGGLAAGQLAVASKFTQKRGPSTCALEFPAGLPVGSTATP